jgi:hypothetical protein
MQACSKASHTSERIQKLRPLAVLPDTGVAALSGSAGLRPLRLVAAYTPNWDTTPTGTPKRPAVWHTHVCSLCASVVTATAMT